MKYNYNLYNKLVFKKFKNQKNKEIASPFKMSFRNRINKINRGSKISPRTTTKKFNY